ISHAGAHTLAGAARLAGLTTLRLRSNPLGSSGVAAILNSSRLAHLSVLDLAQTQCTFAALEELTTARRGQPGHPAWDRLSVLNLSGNELGNLGAQMLTRWPPLAGLQDLDLSRTGLGDDGVAALAGWPHLAGLRRLALNGNRLTEAGKHR